MSTTILASFLNLLGTVALGIVVLVASLVVCLRMRGRPGAIESRALAAVCKLDALPNKRSPQARDGYRQIVQQLEKRARSGELGPKGKEALGRAYLGEGITLLLQKQVQAGRKRIEQAGQYTQVGRADIVRLLASAYVEDGDEDDEAADAYLSYLRLPADQADPAFTKRILVVLEKICRISEGTPADRLARKLRLNSELAIVPGREPKVVFVLEDDVVREHPLRQSIRIGRGNENDLVLSDAAVSNHHAVISVEGGNFTLGDAGSKGGTFLNGKRLESPTQLADDDQIRCGNVILSFYSRPRALNRQLGWPFSYLGIGFFVRKEYARAVKVLQQATVISPEDAETHYYLGRSQQAIGFHRDAFTSYARAVQTAISHHAAHYWWGRALIEQAEMSGATRSSEFCQTRIAEALDHILAATRLDPRNDLYYYALAKVNLLVGRAPEAIEAIRAAIAADGSKVAYHVLLANLARQANDIALAKGAASAALAVDPANREATMILGDIAFELEDYSEAAERLEWLRSLEVKAGVGTYTGTLEFAWRLGRSLFEIGKYQAASRAFGAIAKHSRDAMFYGARCHSCSNRFDSAAKLFRMLLRQYGEDPEARYYLASSLGNLGEYDKALEEAKRIADHREWAARSLCLSAKLLVRQGQWDAGAEYLKRAKEIAPSNEEVQFERGRVACVRGDFAEAVTAFEAALRQAPADARLHLWLGRALFAQGKDELAYRHFKRALAGAGHGGLSVEETRALAADAHFHLGRITRLQSKHEEAIQEYIQARQHGWSGDLLAAELASSYAETDRYPDALAELSSLSMKQTTDSQVAFNMAAVSCRMAHACIGRERYDEAIPLLQQAANRFTVAEATTELAETTEVLAEASFRLGAQYVVSGNGQLAAGITALERARSLRGNDNRCSYYLGVAHFKQSDFERASAFFEEAASDGSNRAAMKALALSWERAGKPEQAETTWNRLCADVDGSSDIEAKLGLAGLYVRRGDWGRAATLLCETLQDPVAARHEAYTDLCKLAVSCLSLNGDHKTAEDIVRQHLTGHSKDTAEAYLGAVLAQQNRLADALVHLRSAARMKTVAPGVLDLYEAVCRALAAQKVLEGDLECAMAYLQEVSKVTKQLSPETQSFLGAIRSATLLEGEIDIEAGETAVASYEKVYNLQPKNPKILRNFAILNHRVAVRHEEEGSFAKADQYWSKACDLWAGIATSDEFWQSYLDSFNEGRQRRDRLDKTDLKLLGCRVVASVAAVNVEFGRMHAAHGRIPEVQRHAGYLKRLGDGREMRVAMASAIAGEARDRKQAGDEKTFAELAELAYKMAPDDAGIRAAHAAALFNKGTTLLSNNDLAGAEKAYSRAQQIDPDLINNPDAKQMLAQFYVAMGCRALEQGDISGFRRHIQEAINLDPTVVAKVNGLLDVCLRLRIWEGG